MSMLNQLSQEEFVDDLTNTNNQITGFLLTLNRFKILFLKCLFIRKRKKIVTLFELLFPFVIFYYMISNLERNGQHKKSNSEFLKPNVLGSGLKSNIRSSIGFNKVYYYFNDTNVNLPLLNKIIKDIKAKDPAINFMPKPENITDDKYFLLYFKDFKLQNIDYELTIQDKYNTYMERPYYTIDKPSKYLTLRQPVNKFHELLLKTFTQNLNPETENYKVSFYDFFFVEEAEPQDDDDEREKKYDYTATFQNYSISLFIAFFINGILLLSSICEERKKRSFEFLKLMGASNNQILFGHFLNHFLFWSIPLIFCLIYYNSHSDVLTFDILFIYFFFGILFFIHLVSFLFLLSPLFERQIYPELLFIISSFFLAKNFAESRPNSNFSSLLEAYHPLMQLRKLANIEQDLSYHFNYNESIFTIFFKAPLKEHSLFTLFLVTCFYIVFNWFVTIYLIEVNPFQRGISKSFTYLFSPNYWIRPKLVTDYNIPKQKEFEEQPANRKPAIILKNVDKSYRSTFFFSKFQVLKNFNFAVYEKQITVLLGHNGAGKTTTMDLISGLLSSEKGQISVQGIPVSASTSDFKRVLGYCPQENIFYETLTVYENLKIAGIIKGASFNSINRTILHIANKFDLQEKLNLAASKLSGGMKRRLCLAIAIIGYNNVLVIDEPTSGLDPENRRKVWEILLELRKYKTILLTTHFMEEADVLGDQVAIMNKGVVKACGSTMFLKRLYHVGYQLRIELFKEYQIDELLNLIRQYVPDAEYENQQANELFFRLLPTGRKDENLNLMIANLFDQFENKEIKERYGIKAYGLTNTSLEDVFIKIGSLDSNENESSIDILNVEDHPLYNLNRIDGFNLYLQQFYAIINKKFKLTFKNLQLFVSSIYPLILPLIFIFIAKAIYDNLYRGDSFTIKSFNIDKNFENPHGILINDRFDNNGLFSEDKLDWINKKYGLKFKKYDTTNATQALIDNQKSLGRSKFNGNFMLLPERSDDKKYELTINKRKNPFSLMGSIELFYQLIAKLVDAQYDVNLKFNFIQYTNNDDYNIRVQMFFTLGINCIIFAFLSTIFIFSFPFAAFVELLHDELNSGSLEMQIIAGLSKSMYWAANLIFDYFYMIFIFIISCILVYIFDSIEILSSQIFLLFTAYILASFSCVLMTYFVINLNIKRELTDILIKYYLLISAGAIAIYDIVYFLVNAPRRYQDEQEEIYLPWGFFFKCISPAYNCLDTVLYIIQKSVVRLCIKDTEQTAQCNIFAFRYHDFKFNMLAYLLSYLLFGFLIFLVNYYSSAVKIFFESYSLFRKQKQTEINQSANFINVNHLNEIKDENVEKEKDLVRMCVETNNLQNNILVNYDLYKLFGTFEAVNHLNFTVKKNECFGLLGINGAGKTTTFKMIGGSILPTSGTIILDGYTFMGNPHEYYRRLGYCPQENTHTKKISVTDNLLFFARINGIPTNLINKTVKTLIEECDLQDHQFKFADNLSGGNKRKLSTAISLIGRKDLILLDEPTTGVDPVARRHLWKTIDFYKKQLQTSFILTSHSMDEVEQLCNTISIMVAGQFKCLGTYSYLREKYSQGFTITIKIKDNKNDDSYVNQLKERMDTEFRGKAQFKEFYMNTMVYIILSKVFNWPYLFRAMESIKENLDLDDFSLEQTNLEKIFLSFAEKPKVD